MLKENIKTDYIRFLLRKSQAELSHFNFANPDIILINNIFNKLLISENPLVDFYILSNVKEFKNVGKYLIFVLKKLEDKVISFDNLSRNIETDSKFILNEFLNCFSNPTPIQNVYQSYLESEDEEKSYNERLKLKPDEESTSITEEITDKEEDEPEISEFKKNYLELIQNEDNESEDVFKLPNDSPNDFEEDPTENKSAFEMPPDSNNEEATPEDSNETFLSENSEDPEVDFPEKESATGEDFITQDEEKSITETLNENHVLEELINNEIDSQTDNETDPKPALDDRIELSEEIQEELSNFEETDEEEEEIEPEPEIQPANALFLEYENEIYEYNAELNSDFDKMINFLTQKPKEETRNEVIKKIIQTGSRLEIVSRKMSLEIISNIYQTIVLSFEKISEGRYDLSEGTLNLFKNGLGLIASLIKGDDYFGYKDILKSIENIRNALMEEKTKREEYVKRMAQKREIEQRMLEKYPEGSQMEKLDQLKQLIKDTENKFKQIGEIEGEYKIYEALRSLSGNLINFKEIVKSARELNMLKLAHLSEGAYIFLKFLQNYRINPVTIEIREIFGYITYNMKSLMIDNESEDIDIFISYLNDPVKIFSKTGKRKN